MANLFGNALDQRSLGAYDNQLDIVVAGEADNGFGVEHIERDVFCDGRRTAVTGSHIQLSDMRRLSKRPRQGVFATATTKHQYVHLRSFQRADTLLIENRPRAKPGSIRSFIDHSVSFSE